MRVHRIPEKWWTAPANSIRGGRDTLLSNQSDLAVVPDDANEICWIFSFDIAEVRAELLL
jgi:hypothetical protein